MWAFTKMHGAGNDFVVLDGVRQTIEMTPVRARALAHRQFGIGCDQILLVSASTHPDAFAAKKMASKHHLPAWLLLQLQGLPQQPCLAWWRLDLQLLTRTETLNIHDTSCIYNHLQILTPKI